MKRYRYLIILFCLIFSATILLLFLQKQKRIKTVYGTLYPLYIYKTPLDLTTYFSPNPQEFIEDQALIYPWKGMHHEFSPITKEYFRCKGSPLNPPVPTYSDGKIVSNAFDCNGSSSHSLPIRYEKEFIYPILIELLNHIQNYTKKALVITSGHRCPIHNTYIDGSMKNHFSKQLIGAEVHFYVKDTEEQYDTVIQAIENFYATHTRYSHELHEYLPLKRYDRDKNSLIQPWMNKEIFIRIFKPHEGRNKENYHPYSYFSLQVRFDRDRQMKVTVTPEEATMYRQY